MIFTIRWVDVSANLQTGKQPVVMLERALAHGSDKRGGVFSVAEVARVGSYYVPQLPLVGPEQPAWSATKSGKHVRVPLHAYLTAERAKSHIVATGFEIGVRAAMGYLELHKSAPKELVLVLGTQVDDLHEEGRNHFRCYVGVAARSD
jgi:hypothetical protein